MTNAFEATKAALEKLTDSEELDGQTIWSNPDFEADHEASRKATITTERIDGLVYDCWKYSEFFASDKPISDQRTYELAEQTMWALNLESSDHSNSYESSTWQGSNGTHYLVIEYDISCAVYPD